ncbi:MAG TPA: subclass B3 metallo-beta-lactamase [Bryobacteraceae bacterium]|jgi:metallo-beta-lactamase class B|nr:subclass B3 metallo-beta-lactamase [Bryobacteraceae bacterium]
MRKFLLSVVLMASLPVVGFSQPKGWNDPFPPFRIMDNLYYVGTKELASFLLVTPQGNILMNSDYESSVPVIKANVEKLGFKFTDVKILIAGHAHPDHVEGDALLKELTGAQVVVGRVDADKTREFRPGGKEHPIDRLIDEGESVTLGGTTLTAHLMPGHTRGCLAWSTTLKENGKSYYTFIECSLNGQFLQSLDNYPGMIDDFRATYKKARTFPVEVWASSHASFFNLAEKYEKMQKRGPGDPNPFVDPEGYKAHVDQYEKSFEAAVAKRDSQAAGPGR